MKKIVTAMLIMVMLLAGCANKQQQQPTEITNVNEVIRETKKEGSVSHIDKDKKEKVYVSADPSGNVTKTEVEVTLKNETAGQVKDVTDLSDIRNTESDEPFTLENGNLVFEGRGEDIHYRGLSNKKLPVNVKVTYYFNDKEVKPEELKGTSGHVSMRFDYENTTSVNKNGFELPYPFIAITAVMLDSNSFSNIEVENGRVIEYEDSKIALIVAAPGLVEALKLQDYELTKEVKTRNYGTVSADVNNFSLEYTATIVTSGLLDELKDEDISDIEEFADKTADFKKESKKLTDNTSKLADAAGKLETGIGSYTSSVDAMASGIDDLSKGADGLKQGLQQLEKALSADPNNKALAQQVSALRQAAEQLADGTNQLSKGASQLTGASSSLKEGAGAIKKASKEFDKAINDFVKNDLDDLNKLGGSALKNVTDRLKTLKEMEKEYGCFSGLAEGATGETLFIIETSAIK